MNNINYILEKKMCCGCGACYSICPKNCIKFISGENVNFPEINEKECIDCGLCIKVCPGNSNINRLIDGQKINIRSNIKSIGVASSTDDVIRCNSASGGLITQIIKSLFEANEIDGAVLTTQNKENALYNEVIIANNIEDILKSQGSRYSPSSNCSVLKDIITSDKYKKIIFVGKPCEIEALGRFCEINKKLNEKIYLKISIMCHHSPTRRGLRNLIDNTELKNREITQIKFRGNGWPGEFSIQSSDGTTYKTTYLEAWNHYLSQDHNEKCIYCENPFPLEADLIVGDPWGKEYKGDKKGKSLYIARTEKIKKILDELIEKKDLEISEVSYSDLERFQVNLLRRYNQFYLNSLLFKSVHNNKITTKDFILAYKERPKNILRYMKVIKTYKKQFKDWKYN